MSAAIADLPTLLAQMQPALSEHQYLYVALPEAPSATRLRELDAFALFAESEGYSAVVRQSSAQALGLQGEGPFALISLRVHSALSAVGLTAAVASALAAAQISANVIAALRHDHLLLPAADGERALAVLRALSAASQSS